jgi:hypothetical protein
MSHDPLRRRLESVRVPDEENARLRALAVVRAGFAERTPAPRRAWFRRAPGLAWALTALVVVALLFTPPGKAVTGWLRDRVAPERVRVEAVRPALGSLPASGSLLVQSPRGAWVVHEDGSKRRLGSYREATWSPKGLFVAATTGSQLVALTPGGQVRWSLPRPRVSAPRWSPSGFRVAYLSGDRLRVVAGDGTGDRSLGARAVAPPAWLPGKLNLLAYAAPDGSVRLVDVDRRELWRSPAGPRPSSLSASGDGLRLLASGPQGLRVLDGQGHELRRSRTPARGAAYAPFGRRYAYVRRSPAGGTDQLVLSSGPRARVLLASPGRLGHFAWSPDGRFIAVAWPSADQWLFVPTGRSGRAITAARIAADFDPGARGPSGEPAPAEWCCSR